MWDVAIIGAGLAGLTCARKLRSRGHQVCVLDKSRGLGGRMATRRVSDSVRVDHGLRYWQAGSRALEPLTAELLEAGILKPWAVSAYELRAPGELVPGKGEQVYVSERGMSAIAKYLAQSLTPGDSLLTNHRATTLTPIEGGWRIDCDDHKTVMAKRCVIAIPAEQTADLLKRAPEEAVSPAAIRALAAVEYDPCLSVLAGYDLSYTR